MQSNKGGMVMDYNEKKKLRKIAILEHEIEYYVKVYKSCKKIGILKKKIEEIKRTYYF